MSEWIPVVCSCATTYNAGEHLACPECGAASANATPTTAPGRTSGVAITTCACGREYNSARLGSCPACGRPSEGQRWSTPLNGTQVRDTSDDDRRKRRRPWIIGGLAGGLLAVVIAGFLV